jgi:hypothetical protein
MELEAELNGCSLPQERATIRSQLHVARRHLAEREVRADALAALPDFWEDIYGPGPGFVALFSGIRSRPDAKLSAPHHAYFAWSAETRSALRWIDREAEDDRELYHCAHLVGRWRRRKTDALPLRSLYVDLDGPLPANPLVEPSVTVESSPGHYQAYFRLNRPVAPPEGAALNRRLAEALGADISGWDLTQLLRIPATVNHKYPERALVRLVRRTEQTYDPEELASLLPPAASPRRGESIGERAQITHPVGGEPPIPLTKAARLLWNGEGPFAKYTAAGAVDRSATLVRIARLLYQAKLPRELILAHLWERDDALGWQKYSTRPDAEEQYQRIVDVVAQGAPTRRQR